MLELITLADITKKYNGKYVLSNLNHTFMAGKSIAFMGHNGCGKSTLLKIVSGLVTPTSGKVEHHKSILFHYVPEKFAPVPLTARAYLVGMGELDGLDKNVNKKQIEQLSRDFFLEELLDVPMKHLSKGTLQKIGVIQALLKMPDVLMLDEPLSGQDESSQKVFIQKVNALRNQGVTVLMSCHETRLVEALADETYTIQNGALLPYHPQNAKVSVLLLENTQNRPVPEGMERFGSSYRLQVRECESQRVILQLLQSGWELRGMYNEEIN